MQTEITPYFQKRLRELPKPIRVNIIEVIEQCDTAKSLRDIPHLKDLKSKKTADIFEFVSVRIVSVLK